jgi:hypothetical protein
MNAGRISVGLDAMNGQEICAHASQMQLQAGGVDMDNQDRGLDDGV